MRAFSFGFWAAVFFLLCGGAASAAPWYEELLVGLEVGPTGAQFGADPADVAYATKFSGKDIVDAQIAAGSQYLVIWGKDGEYAYYDSKVAPKCPGLGERDVLREAVDAARGTVFSNTYNMGGDGIPEPAAAPARGKRRRARRRLRRLHGPPAHAGHGRVQTRPLHQGGEVDALRPGGGPARNARPGTGPGAG